jgi:hypothetical protein
LAAYLSGYLNHRVAPALPRLRQPALVVWGRQAANPPVESADLWLGPARAESRWKGTGTPHAEAPNARTVVEQSRAGRGSPSSASPGGPRYSGEAVLASGGAAIFRRTRRTPALRFFFEGRPP